MMTHVKIYELVKQRELAAIWMEAANMHSKSVLNAISFRDIAGQALDKYFDMLEQILSDLDAVR
jgi:hypothetical protein